MNCQECEDVLSDYLDGDVEVGQAQEIEHHLAECASCQALHAELCQLVQASQRLIPQIGGPSLTTHKVAAQHQSPKAAPVAWWERYGDLLFNRYVEIRLTMTQFLAISALCAGFLGIWVWDYVQTIHPPTPGLPTGITGPLNPVEPIPVSFTGVTAPTQVERAVLLDSIGRLTASLDRRKMNWNPQIRRVFERNMAIIDQSLEECDAVLRANPRDGEAEEMLVAAYREKLRLLQEFAAL